MAIARSSLGRIGARGASRRSARHAEPSNIPTPYDDMPIEQVWLEYQRTADGVIRNFLMEKYLPLVRYNAERIYTRLPDEVDIEDLMSAGLFGLMDAIDAFDLERKVKFETYCAPRIRGAILDELRSMDWVPRLVRQRTGKVDQIRQKIEMETGTPATEEEIADRLGLENEELDKYMRDGKAVSTVSLNRRCFPSDGSRDVREIDIIRDETQTNPLAEIQRNDLKDLITKGLSRAEKLIVLLYYYEGMTMKEIGATLDLSESRVSQMHSSILARLKAQMQHRMKELEQDEE
ncbi:MAG TPA: FliA/WhiG family RNA polymerase sigma factor [Phycisphaerales bacterium]|nr:FliA/WhiG family RNA polymerase sigma factor [Phycisphaerales bacterium]